MADGPTAPAGATRWTMLATVLLAAFLYTLSARGTVLESDVIIQAVGLDRYSVQYVTGPAAVAGLTAIFSSIYLVKAFGARRIFLLGAVCLTAGSFAAARMQDGWHGAVAALVRSGAAFLLIPGLVFLQQILPHHKRFAYCTLLTFVYAGQVIAEPLGALLTFDPSWRALFLSIGVGGIWLILAGIFLFPGDRTLTPPQHPFDYAGAALFATGLGLLLFLLYRGNYLGWWVSTPVCVAAVALAVTVAMFIWRQFVAPEPFMSVRAFAFQTVHLTMLCSLCWCAGLYGVAVLLPKFLLLIGYQHWKTGWVILPMAVTMLATMFAGGFEWRRGRYVWLLRGGLAGMTLAGFALAGADHYAPWQWVMAVTVVWGLCAGVCLAPLAQLTFEGQRPEEAAATGAIKFFMRALGGTLGILLAGVVLDRGTAWGLEYVRAGLREGQGALQHATPHLHDHMRRRGSAPDAAASRTDAVVGSWVHLHAEVIGFRAALRFCAYLSAAALGIACFISRKKEISVYDTDP